MVLYFSHNNINIHVAYLLIISVSSLLKFMPLSKSYKFDYPHTLSVFYFIFLQFCDLAEVAVIHKLILANLAIKKI